MGYKHRGSFSSVEVSDAQQIENLFESLFEDHNWRSTAIATCRFVFHGPKSVRANDKNWVNTIIQTGGQFPSGYGSVRNFSCHRTHNTWVSLKCHEIVSDILQRVGLTIDDVYEEYGTPSVGCKYELKLIDIVRQLTNLFGSKIAQVA